LQKLQVNTMNRITKNEKRTKNALI